MSSPLPPSRTASEEEEPEERNQRLLIVLVVLGILSAIIAGVVITTDNGGSTANPDARAGVRAGTTSLLVGPAGAPTKVVVYEDLADPRSRSFDIASRDFLDVLAAGGRVQVAYQPFTTSTSGYAAAAVGAWGAVLHGGTPRQLRRFQELLLDRQPEPGQGQPDTLGLLARKAGVRGRVVDEVGSPDPAFASASAAVARRAGVTEVPVVLVDGRRLRASSPVALADALQRRLLAGADS